MIHCSIGVRNRAHETGKYNIKLSGAIPKSENPAVARIYEDLSDAVFHPPADPPPSEMSLKYHNRNIFRDGKHKPQAQP